MMSVASMPLCSETLKRMGSIIEISAVFEVISVVKVTMTAMVSRNNSIGIDEKCTRYEAISSANPVWVKAEAMAKPAPKRNIIL